MLKSIQIDDHYHSLAKKLIGERSGQYSIKDVVEFAIANFYTEIVAKEEAS